MNAIGHFFVNAAIAFLLTAAVFLAVNIVFFISGRGNPQAIKTMYGVRRALRDMPSGTVLECRGRRVSALVYDRVHDRDSVIPLYNAPMFSPLSWSAGPRSARALYGRADAELTIAVGALMLVFIPLLAVGIGLAVSVSWLWWLAVFILTGAEVVTMLTNKFFFLKWGAFSMLVPVIFLHRYDLFSLPVTFMICFAWIMISMAATVWIERSS
jgi:hypothetical protein